jgi:hypothetical protein
MSQINRYVALNKCVLFDKKAQSSTDRAEGASAAGILGASIASN